MANSIMITVWELVNLQTQFSYACICISIGNQCVFFSPDCNQQKRKEKKKLIECGKEGWRRRKKENNTKCTHTKSEFNWWGLLELIIEQ